MTARLVVLLLQLDPLPVRGVSGPGGQAAGSGLRAYRV